MKQKLTKSLHYPFPYYGIILYLTVVQELKSRLYLCQVKLPNFAAYVFSQVARKCNHPRKLFGITLNQLQIWTRKKSNKGP